MRVPLSWLRAYADLPAGVSAGDLAARLTGLGLKLEAVHAVGAELAGPVVVGRVRSYETETHSNGKSVRWCSVDVGEPQDCGIVCGAQNFAAGDLVVVALPGAVLPGPFPIAARTTYGHCSDGMICSPRELGLGEEAGGILVLPPDEGEPGSDAVTLLGLRDDVIELEVTPDRSYALSMRGVARESATGFRTGFTDPAEVALTDTDGDAYPVVVHDAPACPRFVTRVVSGVDPAVPSPGWLARRVQLAGMRPVGLVVDVANYVMLELGEPIHTYDRHRLRGPLQVRRAAAGEELRTLDGVQRVLEADDLVIADDRGAIGLAGVMGGADTEIGPDTVDVVIEAAHFAAVPIARTARRHRLGSEASRRFERGADPELVRGAAQRVADLLVEHGGARLEPGETYIASASVPAAIDLDAGLPAAVVGQPIGTDTVVDALHQVGCEVVQDSGSLRVRPPSWRPDLTDPYDLVEEVIRLVGYDSVPSVLPPAPAGRGLTTAQRLRRRVGYALAGAGLVEVVGSPFVGPNDFDRLGLDADDQRRDCVRIANPLSDQRPLLTTTLAPPLLEAVARNVSRGQSSVALSLVSTVFVPGPGQPPPAPQLPVDTAPDAASQAALDAALPAQPRHLAVAFCGEREPAGWWGEARPAGWADAIETVRLVAAILGVDVTAEPDSSAPWHPGRCARLCLDGIGVGHAGELHPRVCRAWQLPPRTSYAEVDLDALLAAAPPIPRGPAFSPLPVAKEDVALIVAADVPAAAVGDALRRGAGELLESLRLFDVYTGPPIPSGHKSLAYSLRLRAPDRTLTETELAAVRSAAVRSAEMATGARLRDGSVGTGERFDATSRKG